MRRSLLLTRDFPPVLSRTFYHRTRFTGFGISFIEAAAAGKPSIAGRSGGARDAVADGETGILVDPESPEKLAAAIKRLLSDTPLREGMGARGRERVERHFSWKDRAKEFALLVTVQPQ